MKNESRLVKEAYTYQVTQQALKQWRKCYDWPCSVTVYLYFVDKRRRDWDNRHKLSMDAMEWTVFYDDSQIEEWHVYKRIDKANPRIEISVEKLL